MKLIAQTMAAAVALVTVAASTLAAGFVVEPLTTVPAAEGLLFPVVATFAPEDFTRLYIVEKRGVIRVLNIKSGVLQPAGEVFLDIDNLVGGGTCIGCETGLLGLAFDPNHQDNGYFYVNYTDNALNTVVRRYQRITADRADSNTGVDVLTIEQPQPNHNGGWIGFSPLNGFLYIATGDGGGAGDDDAGHTPGIGNAQDLTDNLLGKLLRLDVSTLPYETPPDNPFVDTPGDDEIWAYGLRNPWRCAFDPLTGDLFIADVGQYVWEELTVQKGSSPGGENYGWRCFEGLHPFLIPCPVSGPFVAPVLEYDHIPACSIIGGEIYRGCRIPTLDGRYFFADYCAARVWSLRYANTVTELVDRTEELEPETSPLWGMGSFGRDALGELYICQMTAGIVYRIESANPTTSPNDLDCNGVVDVDDLVAVLVNWGNCDGCREDSNGDHVVDVDDLVAVILDWGH